MIRLTHVDALNAALMLKYVVEGDAHYLERQLAEECSEYVHAVLKILRVDAGETPMPVDEAMENCIEELADVILSADIVYAYYLEQYPDVADRLDEIMQEKRLRILDRVMEKREGKW